MSDLPFTGERVVPGKMHNFIPTLVEHLERYTFAISLLSGTETVVDAACGTGYGTFLLAMASEHAIGLDVSAEAVDFARTRFSWPGLEYATADLDACELPADVSMIVSFETIEHLRDPDAFLRKTEASLLPGGVFVGSVPREAPSEWHRHVFDWPSARRLVESYFGETTWYGQRVVPATTPPPGLTISRERVEDADFYIAVCRKKEDPDQDRTGELPRGDVDVS